MKELVWFYTGTSNGLRENLGLLRILSNKEWLIKFLAVNLVFFGVVGVMLLVLINIFY